MVTRRTFLIASAWNRDGSYGSGYLDVRPSQSAVRRVPSMVAWAQPVFRQARPLRRPKPR